MSQSCIQEPGRAGLQDLLAEIRACQFCAADLPHGPRPVLHASATACLFIASQAPGLQVHQTGVSFNDRSGDRLRHWMGVERETFYDVSRVSIAAMAFCFPGYDEGGHDLPPRRECAAIWRPRLMAALPRMELVLLVGRQAQQWHLGASNKPSLTETVRAWREYAPRYIPLPHPSWRNTGWLKKHPWFERDLLPYLRERVAAALSR
jgi:uracil-DNA glycosylase